MSLTANYDIYSGITLDLTPGTKLLLRIENTIAYCTTTVMLLSTGATAVIQYTVDSFEFVEGSNFSDPNLNHANLITDINWQYLSVNGTPTASITSNVTPQVMNAPSYMYLQNTSVGGQNVRVSIRGNKA